MSIKCPASIDRDVDWVLTGMPIDTELTFIAYFSASCRTRPCSSPLWRWPGVQMYKREDSLLQCSSLLRKQVTDRQSRWHLWSNDRFCILNKLNKKRIYYLLWAVIKGLWVCLISHCWKRFAKCLLLYHISQWEATAKQFREVYIGLSIKFGITGHSLIGYLIDVINSDKSWGQEP